MQMFALRIFLKFSFRFRAFGRIVRRGVQFHEKLPKLKQCATKMALLNKLSQYLSTCTSLYFYKGERERNSLKNSCFSHMYARFFVTMCFMGFVPEFKILGGISLIFFEPRSQLFLSNIGRPPPTKRKGGGMRNKHHSYKKASNTKITIIKQLFHKFHRD